MQRTKIGFAAALISLSAILLGWAAANPEENVRAFPGPVVRVQTNPAERQLVRAARSFDGDLRTLPRNEHAKKERPEREPPAVSRAPLPNARTGAVTTTVDTGANTLVPDVPAPSTNANFAGLDFQTWGDGHPPDTNGDVGPQYYIETVNTSIGIYSKATGALVAGFHFNDFMSKGNFGNLCDTNNFGDPVVVYDTFEDRWIITDFAFKLDGSNNVINPPGSFQCFAVSKSGDPVNGGWNFYSINTTGGLGDYPKFGIWPDGLYMSVNMFDYAANGSYQNPRVYAFNKAQMYAGAPTVQSISFDAPASEFTLLPSNARLQLGTPPPGSPNYFSVVWQFNNAISFYKFHVDWSHTSLSTFTGPFTANAPASFIDAPSTVPSKSGNNLDTLADRLMVQNQYTNLGGVESLWNVHTVQGSSSSQAAVRYYQVTVTGGNVASSTTQAATYNPDTSVSRFMPSVALDRAGDMALGYSASSSSIFPAIKYAGRLSTDAADTITQTETSLIDGTGTQSGSCGGTCTRWGDYSAMSLDTDGCTFWYTNLYYATTGLNWQTRIGSFKFSQCTSVGSGGTLSGVVSDSNTGLPISGATVSLGTRTATTDVTGTYTFNVPAGTYPTLSAIAPGYNATSINSVAVADSTTTMQNVTLVAAPSNACPTDTTQSDFASGTGSNVDMTSTPGDVTLAASAPVDQQNTTLGTLGVGFTTTTWAGQTFTAGKTGKLTKADINLFCSSCSGTTPDLTLSVRATSNGLPTGSDLASATITGFSSGASAYYTGTFSSPLNITSGTQYALIIRPNSNPSAGTYALTRSGSQSQGSNVYSGGARISGANSGTSWSAPVTGSSTTDAGFKTYVASTFTTPGSFVSSTKDANPAAGVTPNWTTLSWNAATPANTAVKFQVAGSNNVNGPFSFVGPDGTANTSFTTSGASLTQFDGNRFLQYKALLSTTNTASTPALHDVTVCYSNGTPQIAVEQPAGTGLTSGASSIDFGSIDAGATASNTFTIDSTGNANLAGISVTFGGTNPNDFSVTSAPATLVAPSASTTFIVQFSPTAPGTRAAVMHIASNDPTASPFDVNLTGFSRTYTEAWRSQYFNTTDNTGDAADSNDFDLDGISNLLEFSTGSDPTQPNTMPGKVTVNGSNLEFRYQRSKHAMFDGILFNVEWSDDLTSPTWNTNGITETIESQDSLFQQVKAVVGKGANGHRFMRLRVTRP